MSLSKEIQRKWKPRKKNSHKGDFGRVFILAGSEGYTGAAHLAASAAVRSGAGLVTLGVPQKVYTVLARKNPEVMVRPFASTASGTFAESALEAILEFSKTQDVLAIGPGLSQNLQTQKLVRKLLPEISLPLVIDADGLNALAGHLPLLKRLGGRTVLTPHPGEFIRLFGGPRLVSEKLRRKQSLQMAKRYGAVIVLKGHETLVASPEGKLYCNQTGNPGLAKGGSGDVLTGVIAALLGQKFSLWESACYGVFFHGLAADLVARKVGQVGMCATDVIHALPLAFKKILKW